jgi:hypothetical protein
LISVEEEEKMEKNERKEDRKKSIRRKNAVLVLCVSSLFNDALSNADYIALNGWAMLNNELEKIGKEAVLPQFEVTIRHLPRD